MPSYLEKDPHDNRDYLIDWSPWLPPGDSIASHMIALAPDQPTGLEVGTNTHSTATITVWLDGGTWGVAYELDCDIVSTQGRVARRRIIVDVKTIYADAE